MIYLQSKFVLINWYNYSVQIIQFKVSVLLFYICYNKKIIIYFFAF